MSVSIKQLTKYARDYIDLIAPSLASRQSKSVLLAKDILDVTPLYKRVTDFDYEDIKFDLNLDIELKKIDESLEEPDELDEDSNEIIIPEDKPDEDKNLQLSRTLDDIYRKLETSSYTKQINLKFGRISFQGKPVIDSFSDENENRDYRKIEQHLFSVPVSISIKDGGGKRKYSIQVEDSLIKTDTAFLRKYMNQEYRDQLFKYVATHESGESSSIPLEFGYIDELWAKIKQYLLYSEAQDIINEPDLENVIITLAPKVNHFLSQDLLGIIEAEDDEELLETSLSAWVSEQDMSINEPQDDSGANELFFPFPYDKSQLQVLGKLNNKAAVVEGPPGTGKSQTISNILAHLAATNKKVLFVSQKDQAVRGVKDKLKSLDIPYLFGYIPDRSSKLHSDEDDKDSASFALKGLSDNVQSYANIADPVTNLVSLNTFKPQFDLSINKEREYFTLYETWLALDKYEFHELNEKLSREWLDRYEATKSDLSKKLIEIEKSESAVAENVTAVNTTISDKENLKSLAIKLTETYKERVNFEWIAQESLLTRGLSYEKLTGILTNLLGTFEQEATDRQANFFVGKINQVKLGRKLDTALNDLPQELYESLKSIVFSNESKSVRYDKLSTVLNYFDSKRKLEIKRDQLTAKLAELNKQAKSNNANLSQLKSDASSLKAQITRLAIEPESFERLISLLQNEGDTVFENITKRLQLTRELNDFESLNPNQVHEEIMAEKKHYKSNVKAYIRNRLALNTQSYSQNYRLRGILASISRKLEKSKKAFKTFDALKSDPDNFDAMSGIIPIWMMGLDDASRILPLKPNIFDYVIIDEASQCNISYALPVMFRSKHTILFGDTLQMRDTTIAFKSNEQLEALATKHSIPEDLQIKASEDTVKSVMDIAQLAGFEVSLLKNHYRSPIELIGFSNENFYAPRKRSLQVVNDEILAMEDGRVLKNHVISPDLSKEFSEKTNLSEAYYILNLVKEIQTNPKTADKSIAVLTFFNEQAELIRRVVQDPDVKVATIEGIQGDERDIIIYSFVIKSPKEKTRYVRMTGEGGEINKEIAAGRVNVAFSRAKLQVHCVTSMSPAIWPEGVWIKKYLEYVERNGRVNRLTKSEQSFDSKFEEQVYDLLHNKLDMNRYSISTQVESCGFKIDQVVRDSSTGKRLALEIDGPSHFEDGNGQVRVNGDYERQYVLETAGWEFYRISYIDWQRNKELACEELLSFIDAHFNHEKGDDDDKGNEEVQFTYEAKAVEVPMQLFETLKSTDANKSKGFFGRKPAAKEPVKELEEAVLANEVEQSVLELPVAPEVKRESRTVPVTRDNKTTFEQVGGVQLTESRAIIISRRPDGDLWINEKLDSDKFTGFTGKGFGLPALSISDFVTAYESILGSTDLNMKFSYSVGEDNAVIVYRPDDTTIDVRYYVNSPKYTGFTKKGLRLVDSNAKMLLEAFKAL